MKALKFSTFLLLVVYLIFPTFVHAALSTKWHIQAKVTGFDEKRVKVSLAGGEFWLPRATVIETELKSGADVHLRYDEHTQAALQKLANEAAAQQAKK